MSHASAARPVSPPEPVSRVGSPPAPPAADHRGRVGEAERSERGGGGGWGAEGRSEPSQGSHFNKPTASSRKLSTSAGAPRFSIPTSADRRASVAARRSGAGPLGRRRSSCTARTRAGRTKRATPFTGAEGGLCASARRVNSSKVLVSLVGAASGTWRTSNPYGSSLKRRVRPAQPSPWPCRRVIAWSKRLRSTKASGSSSQIG